MAWRVAAALALLLGLLAAAVLLAVIFVDPETLRKPLAVKISEATGYQVEMQTLDLSFFPVLGLKAGELQARSESRELFAAESLFLEVDPTFLLSRRIKIKRAILLKPVLTVYLDEPGKNSSAAAPSWSATVEKVSLNVDAPLNRLADLDFFQKNVDVEVELQARNTSLSVEGYEFFVPGIEVEGVLKKGKFSQTVHGRFADGNFLLDMTLQPGKNPSDFRSFSLDSHLQFNDINPARLERSGTGNGVFSEGRVSGALRAAGRSLKPQDIHVSGTLNGENLVSGDRRYAARRAVVDLESLNRDRGTVKFALQGAKINTVDLRKITGRLLVSPGKIHLAQGRALPGHGEIRVTGDYAIGRRSYDTQFSAMELRAEEVTKNKLTGLLQFAGRLRGRLTESAATRGLSGKVNVKLTDGTVPAAGFVETFLQLLNLHAIPENGRPGLGYKYFGGDFHLAGGVLSTDNLRLDGSQLKLAAKGRVDLPTGRIDAKIKATPLQLADEAARTILLLGNLLTGGGGGGTVETHFNIAGTLDHPKISFDAAKSTLPAPEKILKGILSLQNSLLKGGK
ncbi:MAG: AsmA-like C-terminal domain-containing protein [Nitrospinales bacterium]